MRRLIALLLLISTPVSALTQQDRLVLDLKKDADAACSQMNRCLSSIETTSSNVNVTHLLPGDKAPYEGYLFTIPAERALRLTDAQLTYEQDLNVDLTKINEEYRQTVDVMQTRIKNQGDELEQLSKIKSPGFFGKEFYFVLGAILSGLVSYGVYKSSK